MDISFLTQDVIDDIAASGRPIMKKEEIVAINNGSFDGQHWPARVSFPDARVAIICLGDKNATYYNFHPTRFPKLEYIYCYGHPCDNDVPPRFPNAIWHVKDNHYFNRYFGKWWDQSDPWTVKRVVLDPAPILVPTMYVYSHFKCKVEQRCAKFKSELIAAVSQRETL